MKADNKPDRELLFASKKLNMLKPSAQNALFSLEVFWCRTAYDSVDAWNKKFHQHSFFELHMALSGKVVFETADRKSVCVTSGSFLLFSAGTAHRISDTSSDFSEFVLAFQFAEGQDAAHILSEKASPFYFGKSTQEMARSVAYMLNQALHERYGYGAAISSRLSCFCLEILQLLAGEFISGDDSVYLLENDDRYKIAKKFIEDNLAEELSVGDVARQVNISARQLNRIIKQAENSSISEMIRRIRVKRVKKLLMTTQKPLSEIAEETGFSDAFQLSKTFKQFEGTTPGRYRRDINL